MPQVGFKNTVALYAEGESKQLINPKPMPVILERDSGEGELKVRITASGARKTRTRNILPGEAEQNEH